ncbi:saccharopine dehydrogenase family protein [Anaeromyxobacter oryzisoli]|uniref:saccharopine dehydrogenase family protein n=1 Tax=Anaeromyxobacter oryzisoli TaxID=2925408 RepID=UPI001F5974D1|nr:saccharopine dehydrogenase NADP-binding domain-containing protein [Anaeromyxobacter sp. SG63]
MSTPTLLIYGAYGYTGALVAREAAARGLPIVLAGRDSERLVALSRELRVPWRAFPLTDPDAIRRGIEGSAAVLHCAGPFVHTWRNVAEACLELRVHYLDLTGELAVFNGIASLGPHAERAGVMLLPGAGYDVVPSDCLAAHLAQRLPGARSLTLALSTLGQLSVGTARTLLAHLDARAPAGAPAVRSFDLGEGPVPCVSLPWGDLATAPRSTGIAEVATYMAVPAWARAFLKLAPRLAPLVRPPRVADVVARLLARGGPGPDAAARARGRTVVYGEAVDGSGKKVAARQRGPEGYTLTALAATEIARRVLAGEVRPGWQTPASAYGPDLVLGIPGVEREDLG